MSTMKNTKSEMVRVRMPHEMIKKLRKKANYSEWVREAIQEKLAREGNHKAA